jgi:low affinity Fe/Cu permease
MGGKVFEMTCTGCGKIHTFNTHNQMIMCEGSRRKFIRDKLRKYQREAENENKCARA